MSYAIHDTVTLYKLEDINVSHDRHNKLDNGAAARTSPISTLAQVPISGGVMCRLMQ